MPEIEYTFNGETRHFVSNYGGYGVGVGTPVKIVFDPVTGDAEELKWTNRWAPTVAMLIFSFLWAWAGIATWPNVN